ncbi:hypothetical protein TEA_017858 [Camellia sinensis var. sinensis]|uniref:Kinesin motor domain-containing protein n=1 Tax=Camellia sinensis var. sinensis TaxID=542762 RepID=A0A4S4DZB4_CAMSN|nr:hypothetical protein TEA_017858 [Camellia sinensis var. sinensis]
MSAPSLSPSIIAKSSLLPETARSSCGTLWVFYYLGELNDSLSYALGAGPLFDVSKDSDYIHTLLAKAIDQYASLKSKVAESNDENKMDPQLEAIVERMLDKLVNTILHSSWPAINGACISPADINVEETLNTLKYANRARNIQNKPVGNRDLMSNEMKNMRQQLEYLQAELNKELSRELHEYHSRRAVVEPRETDAEDGSCFVKRDGLKKGLQSMDASGYPMGEAMTGENYMEIDEAVAKEWEHALLRTTMGKEFNELNKRLEQKESEMKHFGGSDTEALSQHFEKRILKLEEEKKTVQQERDRLLAKIENLVAASDGQKQKMHKAYAQKLKSLETQILDLKKKQDCQLQLLKQKQRSDEAAKRLQDEIKTIKVQKVQLQHKIKHEVEQFRQWKASHEKELLQVLDVSQLSM